MLLGWANLQFGFSSNKELFNSLKDAEEGYYPDGRSHVGRMFGSRKQCTIPPGDLARYDDNVRPRTGCTVTLRVLGGDRLWGRLEARRRANNPFMRRHDLFGW